MSYLEFDADDISPRNLTLGRAFHHPPKPPFSCFAQVTARARAIARASCQSLIYIYIYIYNIIYITLNQTKIDSFP